MEITIDPKGDKGRSFSAELLAYAEADSLWESGGTSAASVHRPIWAVIGGSELEMKAFLANLLTGKVASHAKHLKFEFLRSVGYAHHTVKIGGGAVTTLYLPELFNIDPGMVDPDHVRFVVIPPKAWVDAQHFDLAEARSILEALDDTPWKASDSEVHELLAEGVLFLSYVDRRCRYPIPFSPVLGAWLVKLCQRYGYLHRDGCLSYGRGAFKVVDAAKVNVLAGFAFSASHEALGDILSAEIKHWFEVVGHGA